MGIIKIHIFCGYKPHINSLRHHMGNKKKNLFFSYEQGTNCKIDSLVEQWKNSMSATLYCALKTTEPQTGEAAMCLILEAKGQLEVSLPPKLMNVTIKGP